MQVFVTELRSDSDVNLKQTRIQLVKIRTDDDTFMYVIKILHM